MRAWLPVVALSLPVLAVFSCSEGGDVEPSGGSGAAGPGSSASSSSSSGAGAASASSSGAGGEGASSGGSGGTATGGSGGSGGSWPTCDSQPASAPTKTLHEIWQDDPAAPTEVWVPGVYVTAVSKSACQGGVACQIFVQQQESFASLAAGSQQALKIFVSASTAEHFTTVAVGDRVDVYAHAWRYDIDGQNELLLQVTSGMPGCAKTVGQGTPTPVTVTLNDLSVAAYESTIGPLLVKVDNVSGKPALPTETFGLWTTGTFDDAGIENVTSLSPFFLAGGAFTGLTQGQTHDFVSVTGVFGLFVIGMPVSKYEEIYPRTMADVVQ